ncbi:glycosyltransferase [Planctomonas psychrotolerans]|uniref:glycosyltransferase n=1 Tax=Planctomonas psychrotolerans TaxID=2528712 RepID=UPI001D0D185C|nr:glycosyltransferase [Planctomonas psychrotolerans]
MLLTAGTRGDVEPFAALARYASARGHEVRLAVPDDSGVDLTGVDAVRLDLRFGPLLPESGMLPWTLLRHVQRQVRPALRRMFAAAVRETVAFAPDMVVHHPLILSAPMVADALGVPRVLVEFSPVATPSAEFTAPGGPTATRDLGRYNRATYAVPRAAARLFDRDVARAAAEVPGGQAPAHRSPSRATLMAVSPELLPRPRDWPEQVHLTGAWHDSAAEASVDPAVADFVRDREYLVASFGSMAAGDARARGRAVMEAARAHGLGVLALTGWGGLAVPDECRGPDVLAVRAAPFDAVLPGAVLAVHHGGAGTSHAVARAGIPSVVVPFSADQPFWGARLHQRGVAAQPIPSSRLTADSLSAAIAEALTLRDRAERMGHAMRKEDGLAAALRVLESL